MEKNKFPKVMGELPLKDFGFFVKPKALIHSAVSKHQKLEVLDSDSFGKILRLDGAFQTSEGEEFFYHETLVHPAMCAHPNPKSVLVIGGGDGGTAKQVLKHGCVERLVMVELDESVTRISREYLPSVSGNAFDDSRLELRFIDSNIFVEKCDEKFDVVLLDLTDPSGPSLELFTKEFYSSIARLLNKNGLVGLHCEPPITRPKTFNLIVKTLESVFKFVRPYLGYVPLYGGLWGYAVVSNDVDAKEVSTETIGKRLADRNVGDLKIYSAERHSGMLSLPGFAAELLKEPAEPLSLKNLKLPEEPIEGFEEF